MRISPELLFGLDVNSPSHPKVLDALPFADVLIRTGRVSIPLLSDGFATWADIDNDGDQDLLLTGEDRDSGLLTTRLLANPIVGDADSFESLQISLPGLQRGDASWGDYDLDGDLDLAITGAQGSSETPYLQVFANTTSQRLDAPSHGEPPFSGTLNRQPDAPTNPSYTWNEEFDAVQLNWSFSHLAVDDAPYTFNLGLGRGDQEPQQRVFDVISPLSDPVSGQRRVASPGNQGFHNAGLFSAGRPGETYSWSIQSIDSGMRASTWTDGSTFTIQPLQPDLVQPDLVQPDLDSLDLASTLLFESPASELSIWDPSPLQNGIFNLSVDLDHDGLIDRVSYDDANQSIHVFQQEASGSERPFVGPSMGLKPASEAPSFLAELPDSPSNLNLSVLDRSYIQADARSHWHLASNNDEIISFSTDDEVDLDGSRELRQLYRLATTELPQDMDVILLLNGENIREELPRISADDDVPTSYTNLSFSLEDLRSGSLRALFHDAADASASLSTTLSIEPIINPGDQTYDLTITDEGDDRPDLLVRWYESDEPRAAVVPNRSVGSNVRPLAPSIQDFQIITDVDGVPLALSVDTTFGSDGDHALTAANHQWHLSFVEPDGTTGSVSGAFDDAAFDPATEQTHP